VSIVRTRRALGVAMAALAVTSAGCASSSAERLPTVKARTAGNVALRVGAFEGADSAPIFMGVKDGAFKKAGFNVTASTAPNGTLLVSQITAGQIDVGLVAAANAALAYSRGVPIAIIQGMSYITKSDPDGGLVVKASSSVRSMADLKGKTVASSTLENQVDLGIREAIAQAGGNPLTGVKVVPIAPADQLSAVEHGEVDAAVIPQPFFTAAKANKSVRVLPSPLISIGNSLISAVLVARPSFLSTHKAEVLKFLKVMASQTNLAEHDPSKVRAILPSYTGLDPSLAAKMGLPEYNPTIIQPQLSHQMKLMASLKWLPSVPSLNKLVWAPGLSVQ
jgi:NitT/TauT family transport system substrate-binding protein